MIGNCIYLSCCQKKKPKFCKMPYPCHYYSALLDQLRISDILFTLLIPQILTFLNQSSLTYQSKACYLILETSTQSGFAEIEANICRLQCPKFDQSQFLLGNYSSKVRVMVTIKMEFLLYVSFALSFLLASK